MFYLTQCPYFRNEKKKIKTHKDEATCPRPEGISIKGAGSPVPVLTSGLLVLSRGCSNSSYDR